MAAADLLLGDIVLLTFISKVFWLAEIFGSADFFAAERLSFAGFEWRKIISPKIGERFICG
jgi:hypothetical protein